jgi:hypothetical protein
MDKINANKIKFSKKQISLGQNLLKIANSLRSDMLFSDAFFDSLNCFFDENSQLFATLFHPYLPSKHYNKKLSKRSLIKHLNA